MAIRRNEIDMIHGPLAKKIVLFALPLAASAVLQQLFNAADLAVVGNFASSQAMAAVGSNGSVVGLIVNLFTGLAVGSNVLIGNLVGAGRRSELKNAVHTIITTAIFSGIILLVAGILLARPILTMMACPYDVIDLAVLYLRIYFCGMPAIMMYNFGSAILRSKGDSRRPFLALTFAGILNVGMNLLFVIVFKLHVIGVGVATVLSNCVSAGLVLHFLLTEEEEFRLDLRQLKNRFCKNYLVTMAKVGIPAGLQGMVFSISNVTIQSAVNSFGSEAVAGISAARNVDSISYCLINSFGQTAVTFAAQNYGAGDEARVKKVFWLCLGIVEAADIALLGIIFLFRHQFIRLFTTDEAVIAYAMVSFFHSGILHFMNAFYEIPGGIMRGMGHSLVPALITVVGTCALRLLYVFFVFPLNRTPGFLITVYPISWVVTSTAMNIVMGIVRKKAFAQLRGSAA